MTELAAQTKPHLQLTGVMGSDVGLVRTLNEDTVLYDPQKRGAGAGRGELALVADGMGGHAAGEVASALAAEVVHHVFFELDGPIPEVFSAAFAAADRTIREWAEKNPACKGMGTTCTALALYEGEAWLAHVGDSRAYLLRDSSLKQLTEDQTLVAKLVREGTLTEQEAETSSIKNVVLQALGTGGEIQPEISRRGMPLEAGDVLILCSDGLSNMVPDATIADIAGRLPPDDACRALIDAALAAGGHDNISLGVFRAVNGAGETAVAPERTTRPISLVDAATTREIAQYQDRSPLGEADKRWIKARLDTVLSRDGASTARRPGRLRANGLVERFRALPATIRIPALAGAAAVVVCALAVFVALVAMPPANPPAVPAQSSEQGATKPQSPVVDLPAQPAASLSQSSPPPARQAAPGAAAVPQAPPSADQSPGSRQSAGTAAPPASPDAQPSPRQEVIRPDASGKGNAPTADAIAKANAELLNLIETKDFAKAVDLARQLAEAGDPDAQEILASLYASGRGVLRNDAQAASWYRKAAEQGNAKAQKALGDMYAAGRGVPRDGKNAAQWYRKAAERGNMQAREALDALRARGDISD